MNRPQPLFRPLLSPRSAPWNAAFFNELQRAGLIEGQNLSVDGSGYGLRLEQLAEHAPELVKAQVDVIFCAGDAAIRAGQQARKTIPILAITDDMGCPRVSAAPRDMNAT